MATLAKANAGVQQAQAQLDAVQAGARPGDLAAAHAEVRRAEAQLELAKMGPRPEALAVADVDVAAAKAEVDQARAELQENELRAPFAGTVVTLEAKAGELSAPGQPLARLAEFSKWRVETTNLAEINVAQVHEGDAVKLTFDALPGVQLAGKVTAIRGLGENRQGDTVYTVTVTPIGTAPGLRWNMTTVGDLWGVNGAGRTD